MSNHVKNQMNQLLDNAIVADDPFTVASIIDKGGNPNYETKNAMTPLIRCTILSNNSSAEKIVACGAIVDYCNKEGLSALMWACKRGDLIMIHSLLKLGANPSFEGHGGESAVSLAVRHSHKYALEIIVKNEVTKQSLNGGLDRTIVTSQILNKALHCSGLTPLMICVKHKMRSMERVLLKMGAIKDNALDHFYTPTDGDERKERISFVKATKSIDQNDVKSVIDLILNGLIPPDIETENGKTPLMICSTSENGFESTKILLRYGADPCYNNCSGETALMSAAATNNSYSILICMLLLEHAENTLDKKNIYGRNALYFATSTGCKEVQLFLLLCRKVGVVLATRQSKEELDMQNFDLVNNCQKVSFGKSVCYMNHLGRDCNENESWKW
eukprot:CAMPEP_0194383466 /NCGR_PEP_ID=MMETSP0174-20130528/67531_1 /TAXON_ID=216777 /ORGANISM="Proboscia alata, Strain PI-D3" /LENGTH=387 /DNA_ID=CAMNT_0039169719 /DNA_START=1136 /DNA_END=2296 /DNA_ORIENTATION=-